VEHNPNPTAYSVSLLPRVVTSHAENAAIGLGLSGKNAEQGGLAHAVGAEQDQNLTPLDRKLQVPKDGPVSEAFLQTVGLYGVVKGSGQWDISLIAEIASC
jgi:hypothetical protein